MRLSAEVLDGLIIAMRLEDVLKLVVTVEDMPEDDVPKALPTDDTDGPCAR